LQGPRRGAGYEDADPTDVETIELAQRPDECTDISSAEDNAEVVQHELESSLQAKSGLQDKT